MCPLAFRESHCVYSGGACGWRCQPSALFPPSSLSALPSPGLLGDPTVSWPGSFCWGPFPHHTASSGSGLSSRAQERRVLFLLRGLHALLKGLQRSFELLPLLCLRGFLSSLFQFKLKLFPTLPCFPRTAQLAP